MSMEKCPVCGNLVFTNDSRAKSDERLREENAKLRELVRRNWYIAASEREALRVHEVNPDDGAYIHALDETMAEARLDMSKVGVEVDAI